MSEQVSLLSLDVVMVKSRFPENVGMAARACANMGAGNIILVDPERWNVETAAPLATAKGLRRVQDVRLCQSLSDAVGEYALVVGTTARTGGWRQELLSPEQAAAIIVSVLAEGEKVAVVMGPEDRGLNNAEIESCHRLVTIPTAEASSLNVAQSVLILLYECLKCARYDNTSVKDSHVVGQDAIADTLQGNVAKNALARRISAAEQEQLYITLKDMLLAIDYVHADNPDYFLMPLRRFLGRTGLRRHEYNALMGVCRQMRYMCKK